MVLSFQGVARAKPQAGELSGFGPFFQFARKECIQDYGYLVLATGDAKAKEDISGLLCYVTRE